MTFYILSVIVCSGIFYLLYRTFVQHKASYTFCRRYLILTMLLAAIIPTLKVPLYHIEDTRQPEMEMITTDAPTPVNNQPVATDQPATTVLSTPTVSADAPATTAQVVKNDYKRHLPGRVVFKLVLFIIYVLGVLVSLGLTVRSLIYIIRMRNRSILTRSESYTMAENSDVTQPFSFLDTIFLGRKYEPWELRQIMSHESSHIRHRHSQEKLFMSVLRSLLWFNPFIWMSEKSLEEVQEWQADNDALHDGGYDVDEYRDTVIRMLFGLNPLATTGMSNSFTRKRLLHMKENESKGHLLAVSAVTAVVASALFLCFGCRMVVDTPPMNDDSRAIPGSKYSFMATEGQYREYLSKSDRMYFSLDDLIYSTKSDEARHIFFPEEVTANDIQRGLEIMEHPGREIPTLVCINGYKMADFPSSKELKWMNDKTLIMIGKHKATLSEFRALTPQDYLAIVYYRPKRNRRSIPSVVYVITEESIDYNTCYNFACRINGPDVNVRDVISPGGYGLHGNYFVCQTNINVAITEHFAINGHLVSLEEFREAYNNPRYYNVLILRGEQASRIYGSDVREVAELRSFGAYHVRFIRDEQNRVLAELMGKYYEPQELKDLAKYVNAQEQPLGVEPLTQVEINFDQTYEWLTDDIVQEFCRYIPWDDPTLIIEAFRVANVTRYQEGYGLVRSRELLPVSRN